MGIHRFGAPWDEIRYLAGEMSLQTFVEGGTFKGETAREAARRFPRVITIERSDAMFAVAREALSACDNVHLLQGDTRTHLPAIAATNDRILYWLDAHWSGGETYGRGDECPLLEELRPIFASGRDCAILVDDARLFMGPPPKPHAVDQWPTLKEIVEAIPDDWQLIVHEDVVYLLPRDVALGFRQFLQDRQDQTPGRPARGILARLLGRFRRPWH